MAKGTDHYLPEAGVIPSDRVYLCGVCNAPCNERRSVIGYRSFAEAAANSTKSVYDEFACPNRNMDWHKQAYMLMEHARNTPSASLASLYEEEIRLILSTRKTTKEDFHRPF